MRILLLSDTAQYAFNRVAVKLKGERATTVDKIAISLKMPRKGEGKAHACEIA